MQSGDFRKDGDDAMSKAISRRELRELRSRLFDMTFKLADAPSDSYEGQLRKDSESALESVHLYLSDHISIPDE